MNKEHEGDSLAPDALQRRFERPRISFMNLPPDAAACLDKLGYSTTSDSFGMRFAVKKENTNFPLAFPSVGIHLKEADIVVADLSLGDVLPAPENKYDVADFVEEIWADMSYGVIDPRPLSMLAARDDLDRVLVHNGVFLIFSDVRVSHTYKIGKKTGIYFETTEKPIVASTWELLSILSNHEYVSVADDSSTQITVDTGSNFGKLLSRFVRGAVAHCALQANYRLKGEMWTSIAKNKFGQDVAALIESDECMIFIVPQLADKAGFATAFVSEYLPEIRPDLFPDSAATSWVYRAPYESDEVLSLQKKSLEIQQAAANEVEAIALDIQKLREENKLCYGLLTETGDELVRCVVSAMGQLGFEDVVDVDAAASGRKNSNLAEDIQVLDCDPILLGEVKGIAGMPADDDILSANKYLALRMKEWGKTNLKALSVINHQRNLPALERKENLIRPEIEPTVLDSEIGLITTFDLYRLVGNKKKFGWKPEWIRPLFARSGRIEPVPTHYKYVGRVARHMNGICGICVEADTVCEGDTLAFQFSIYFEERIASGIQVENAKVKCALVGQTFGIATSFLKSEVLNVRVFVVRAT